MGALKQYLDCQIAVLRSDENIKILERKYMQFGSLHVPLYVETELKEAEDKKQKYTTKQNTFREHFMSVVKNYSDNLYHNSIVTEQYLLQSSNITINFEKFVNKVMRNKENSIGLNCSLSYNLQDEFISYISYSLWSINKILPVTISLHNKKINDVQHFLRTSINKQCKISVDDIIPILTKTYRDFNELDFPIEIYLLFTDSDKMMDRYYDSSFNELEEFLGENSVPHIMMFRNSTPEVAQRLWEVYDFINNPDYISSKPQTMEDSLQGRIDQGDEFSS